MKRIAFICNFFPSLSETFIYREILGLLERGVPLKVYSIRDPEEDNISRESSDLRRSTTYLLPVNVASLVRAHLHFLFRRPVQYFYAFFFLLTRRYAHQIKDRKRTFFHCGEGVLLAWLIMREGDIHHIHAHYGSHPATLALVVSLLTGIPFSFTAHAHDIWSDRLILKEKISRARFVITCSRYGKKVLVEDNDIGEMEKIHVIHHGLDAGAFQQRKDFCKKEKFTILNVGRLFDRKGHKSLITACKVLKEEGYRFECYIIGDGPAREKLERLIEEFRLTDSCFLLGRVFQEKIRDYYQKADLFVLASESENLPNVLLESMAMGVPVIATTIAGIPELIVHGETGLLFRPNDVEAMVGAIKLILHDKALYEKLSVNGRVFVAKNFSFKESIDKIIQLYRLHGVLLDDRST